MKRQLISILAATILLTGCTQNDAATDEKELVSNTPKVESKDNMNEDDKQEDNTQQKEVKELGDETQDSTSNAIIQIREDGQVLFDALFATATDHPEESIEIAKLYIGKILWK